ncbi:MAG: long-chain-acyl-CoA synthetase [Deltaproteobacteria bacterium]|nr:long-chain-acyl-CoA synthetase [Deltaproteobacteria bacterium]
MGLMSTLRFLNVTVRSIYTVAVTLKDGTKLSAAKLVEETAAKSPNQACVKYEDRVYTYKEFNEACNRVADAFLKDGAKKGDVVALLMDNRPEYLITMVGLNKIGVVTSLINTHVTGVQLVHAIKICNPRWIMVGNEHLANLKEIEADLPNGLSMKDLLVWSDTPDVQMPSQARLFNPIVKQSGNTNPPTTADQTVNDPMIYMYTSGTTGLPKAALIKNQRFLRAAFSFGRILSKLQPSDTTYLALPLYHATGAVAAWGAVVATGSAIALRRKFSATQFWDDVVKYDATAFNYIGEVCRYLLHTPPHPLERKHKLRLMIGAGMRKDVWIPFVERFGVKEVIEFYAATEGNVAIVNIDGEPGMLGRLLPGQRVVKIDAETEEIVRDAQGRCVDARPGEQGILVGLMNQINRFDGYLDKSKTEEKIIRNAFGDGNDYFNTGDLVNMHKGKKVSFADRLGDTYRWKGENVSTNEVSIVLNQCPGVIETNVYGVEVPGAEGRAGMAAVVVNGEFDVARFGKHVAEGLPRYALPYFIRLQKQLELTGSFKYVKTHLKKEGFDPAKVNEPVYFFDSVTKTYVPVTPELFERINRGEVSV